MASPVTLGECTVCAKSDARVCGRCKSARYCSKGCQEGDWPIHKLLCATFASFNSARPTDEHVRGILFPVDKGKPQVIWIHGEWEDDEDEGRYQFARVRHFLGPENPFPKHITIQRNIVLDRDLSDTILLCFRDTFLIDGSKPNMSVAAITTTKPGKYHDWRGPIVAYGKNGLGIDQISCRDLDMNDFRHITDYFLSYGYEQLPSTGNSGEKVKGVRINCLGDEKICKKPHFEAVEIALSDSIFSSSNSRSDIADRIGLPIFTRRCEPDPRWSKSEFPKILNGESAFNNQDATFLHLSCDPNANSNPLTGKLGWGWAPMQWQNSVGSAIVVRQDKKPLLPLQAEALCRYCRYEIRPLLAHTIGEYAPDEPMSKDLVLSMICRPTFSILWYKFLDEKGTEKQYTSVPFPYEM